MPAVGETAAGDECDHIARGHRPMANGEGRLLRCGAPAYASGGRMTTPDDFLRAGAGGGL